MIAAMMIETKSPNDRILRKKKIFCQTMKNLGKHLFKKSIVYYAIAQIDIDPPPLSGKRALWALFLIYPSSPPQLTIHFFIKVFPKATFGAACGKFPMTLVREVPTTFSLTYKAPLLPLLSNKLCQQIGSHY